MGFHHRRHKPMLYRSRNDGCLVSFFMIFIPISVLYIIIFPKTLYTLFFIVLMFVLSRK
jgi:hypothetical protein